MRSRLRAERRCRGGRARRRAGRAGRRLVCLTAVLVAAACGEEARDETLVVRSSLPRDLLDYAEAAFEGAHPTVDVRMVRSEEAETLRALRAGDEALDVWWGAPAPLLAAAAAEELLEPYRPGWADRPTVEGAAAAPWTLSLVSPIVLAFNRQRTELSRAPRDWVDLFHLRWRGEIVLADPTREPATAELVGAMLVEALRDADDLGRGFDWLFRLDGVVSGYVASHDEAVRRLGDGRARVAILPRHVAESARHGAAPWLHYRVPESGTHLLSLGVAVAVDAGNLEGARRFVDLVGSVDVATEARLRTRWTSAHEGVDSSRLPPDFELAMPWRGFALAPDTLASELEGWLERWSREVRGQGRR